MKKRLGKLILVALAALGVCTLVGALLVGLVSRTPLGRFAPAAPLIEPEGKQAQSDAAFAERGRAAAPGGAVASVTAPKPAAAPPQAAQSAPVDFGQRLIVRTANLVLQVDEVPDAAIQIRNLADSLNGFVVSAVQREENAKPAATVTIRVPAERFDEAMDRLRGLAVRVTTEQVSSRDVTEEFVDTDARLRNLKATEERYLALLQQARTVEDILKIEQQLSNIRGQIEQLQGRLQFLQRSAQTSLITVELRPYAVAQNPPPADWSLAPVLNAALAALLNLLKLALSALVWVLVFAPIWLPLGYLLWRRRRRGAPRMTPASPTATA